MNMYNNIDSIIDNLSHIKKRHFLVSLLTILKDLFNHVIA